MDPSILIVDDDELLLETYKSFLELEGYSVLAASSPYKALQLVEKNKIALAILDYNLPNMNGVQLGHLILKIHEKAKIMFISGNSNIKEYAKEAKYEVSSVLSKPIEVSHLIKTIKRITNGPEKVPEKDQKEINKVLTKINRCLHLNRSHYQLNKTTQMSTFVL